MSKACASNIKNFNKTPFSEEGGKGHVVSYSFESLFPDENAEEIHVEFKSWEQKTYQTPAGDKTFHKGQTVWFDFENKSQIAVITGLLEGTLHVAFNEMQSNGVLQTRTVIGYPQSDTIVHANLDEPKPF